MGIVVNRTFHSTTGGSLEPSSKVPLMEDRRGLIWILSLNMIFYRYFIYMYFIYMYFIYMYFIYMSL